MQGRAYDSIASLLFSDAPNLVVSPRRRRVSTTSITVPATGSTVLANLAIPLPASEVLAAGEALFIEWAQLQFGSASLLGVTLGALSFDIVGNDASLFVIGQPTATLFAVPTTGAELSFLFSITPQLWTSYDLNFALGGGGGPLIASKQPLSFRPDGVLNNSNASGITVTPTFFVYYRKVTGLQEA